MLIKCLGEDLPENCFTRTSARTTVVAGRVWTGVQPVLHFGGGAILLKFSFDDVIVLIQLQYKFFENGHL